MFILPSASLISKKVFDEVGGFDTNLIGYEDDDLFLRIFQAGYGNRFIDKPLSKWRIHPESTSYTIKMAISRSIYMRKLMMKFPDDPRRSRFYHRDLIAPRFRPHLVHEYLKAIRDGDEKNHEIAVADLKFLLSGRVLQGRTLKLMMLMTANPTVAKLVNRYGRPFRRFILHRLAG
jgi:hypothetical protein